MLKVCHLSTVHGAMDTRILLKECSSLAQKYSVTLIANHCKKETINGVKIIPINLSGGRAARFLWGSLKIFKLALNQRADVFHIHDPELAVTLFFLKIFTKSKVIYDVHEDIVGELESKPYLKEWQKKILKSLFYLSEKSAVSFCDYCITATDHIRSILSKNSDKIKTINNYPILNELSIIDRAPSKSICYIGSITEIRGLTTIVKSLEGLDVKLNLAGTFSSEEYEKKLKKEDGWSNVKEFGYVDRNEMSTILSSSIAGLVMFHKATNHIYSQPNKLFEYMSAGVPVICSNFPLWQEIIEKGECGITVDPTNISEIHAAIIKLKNDHELCDKFSQNGKKLVLKKYNWNIEEKKLFAIYSELEKNI